jgi:hypothetical protein
MNESKYTRKSALSLLACAVFLVHCGGSDSTSNVESSADAQSKMTAPADTAAPKGPPAGGTEAAAAPSETPRQKTTRLILQAWNEPIDDPHERARIASAGLAEGGYGLPEGQIKAFDAIVSPSIDPSQCARILGATLEETAKPLVEKRCGNMDALVKRVTGAPKGKMTQELIKTCKITEVAPKDTSKLNPWAVLASAIVLDQFAADPQSNDDEKKVARAIAYLCKVE